MRVNPTISALLPRDWAWKESISLLSPDGRANVIASSEVLGPELDSLDYATIQGQLLEDEFPDYRQHSFEPTSAFGQEGAGYLRHFEWTPPDSGRVVQFQLYLARNGRGFTATATAGVQDFHVMESVLVEILGSLTTKAT